MINASYPSQVPKLAMERSARNTDVPSGSMGIDSSGLFGAVLDTLNPLQQLPVVSSLYRAASGDGISAMARIAGGGLFGGPTGLIASAAHVLLEAVSGDDLAGHVFALFGGEESAPTKGHSIYANAAKSLQKPVLDNIV